MDERTKKKIEQEAEKLRIINGLSALTRMSHGDAKTAGWHDKPREIGTLLALVHSEISEALEGHRKGLMDDHLPHREMFEVELADAIIRICDIAGLLDLDLGSAAVEKLAYNRKRADHKQEIREQGGGKKF